MQRFDSIDSKQSNDEKNLILFQFIQKNCEAKKHALANSLEFRHSHN